jgi:hypothetical protein
VYIFASNYYSIVTETEEVLWVMEGTVCAEDYTFYGKMNYILWTGLFIHQSTK